MEENVPPGSVCCFCLTTLEDEALYGKFYKIEELTTHYFCLLLSAKIQQRGSDNEGILGFLTKDIRTEIRRGKSLACSYCHKRGATISCHSSKCKIHFHLPCGRARDTFHQFFGEFKSFCFRHRKTQSIKKEVLKAMSGKQSTCSICFESVPATPSPSTLWAPCCSKEAWFHRLCIQRLALSAGYFFKCPLCNNTNQFVESMRSCGVWIPEQDASWERDPDRYDGLLQRHNMCDAKSCRCRQGRTFHMENTKWEIKLCADCGSQGLHVHCGNLRITQDWVCATCAEVCSPKQKERTGKISRARQSIAARNRRRRSLPARPIRRMTRQRQLDSEEEGVEEEEEVEMNEKLESKKTASAEVVSPRPVKGVCGPPLPSVAPKRAPESAPKRAPESAPKGAPESAGPPALSPPPMKPVVSEQRGLSPQRVQPASDKEDGNVEIIDIGDNSDDDIEILPTPNIRVIKTKTGLSVPVVKVCAAQPAGEQVMASGEPCQLTPFSCINLDGPDDDDDDDKYMDLCEPSTSQSVGVHRVSSVTMDENLAVTNDATERHLHSSSSNDDIMLEFERSSQITQLPEVIVRPSVIVSPAGDDVGAANLESHKKPTGKLISNAPSTTIFKDSARPPVCASHPSPNHISLSELPNSSGHSISTHLIDHERVPNFHSRCQPSPSTLQTLLTRGVETAKPSTDLQNLFAKAVSNPPVARLAACRQEQLRVPTMETERFFPVSNHLQSRTEKALDLTISSVNVSPDAFSAAYSAPTLTDSGRSSMSAWHSKMLQLTKEDTNFTQHSSPPGIVPNNLGISYVQPSQAFPVSGNIPMCTCSTVPSASYPTTSRDTFSTIPHARTCLVHSGHPNSLTKGKTIQTPMFSDLQNQSVVDWSVQVTPTSNQIGVDDFVTARHYDTNYPGMVYERTSGPVFTETFLWQDGDSSEGDEIVLVDDDPQLDGTTNRKRKQKLVERQDFTQCVPVSNAYSHGEPRRMSHLPAHAKEIEGSGMFADLSAPLSQVVATTGARNIYIMVNPVLPPSKTQTTISSQNFLQP